MKKAGAKERRGRHERREAARKKLVKAGDLEHGSGHSSSSQYGHDRKEKHVERVIELQEKYHRDIEELESDISELEATIGEDKSLEDTLRPEIQQKQEELKMKQKQLEYQRRQADKESAELGTGHGEQGNARVDWAIDEETQQEMGPTWWRMARGGYKIEHDILSAKDTEALEEGIARFEESFEEIPHSQELRTRVLKDIHEQVQENLAKKKPDTFDEGRDELIAIRSELRSIMEQEDPLDDPLSSPLEGPINVSIHNAYNMIERVVNGYAATAQLYANRFKECVDLLQQAKDMEIPKLWGARKAKRGRIDLIKDAKSELRGMDINKDSDFVALEEFDTQVKDEVLVSNLETALDAAKRLKARQFRWTDAMRRLKERLPDVKFNIQKTGLRSWQDLPPIEREEAKVERIAAMM